MLIHFIKRWTKLLKKLRKCESGQRKDQKVGTNNYSPLRFPDFLTLFSFNQAPSGPLYFPVFLKVCSQLINYSIDKVIAFWCAEFFADIDVFVDSNFHRDRWECDELC